MSRNVQATNIIKFPNKVGHYHRFMFMTGDHQGKCFYFICANGASKLLYLRQESKGGAMFLEQQKQASRGRENFERR